MTDDGGHFTGIVRINDLLAAPAGQDLGSIVEDKQATASLDDDQEQIAVLATENDMIAVPVIDPAQQLVGAVPAEALLEILRREHMEDPRELNDSLIDYVEQSLAHLEALDGPLELFLRSR